MARTSMQRQVPGGHHLGGAAARVSGGESLHKAAVPSRFVAMDAHITLKNPDLGLFEVDTDPHIQGDAAADLLPLFQSAKMGNKEPSPKTGNLSNVPKKSNLGSSLGVAAAENNSEEALEVENQVIRRNKDDESLLHAEGQHNNSTMHAVKRDLAKGNDQAQPQALLDSLTI
ncbi:hypothetical protein TorRG33x02_277910 [Trema orientale]|uniref:Uncharacterized protein n=1 Tax=Trema orientale TaxID=63057 RepID=A0A2P5CP37_TREOI|nr:hypothetical protein TorRG33x02_277910 [Trema orientale]